MPGYAIEQMMKVWGGQPLQTVRDIEIFANELWKSKEQFERELRDEQDKRDLAMVAFKKRELQKSQYFKEQSLFRMQALEGALAQTKAKY